MLRSRGSLRRTGQCLGAERTGRRVSSRTAPMRSRGRAPARHVRACTHRRAPPQPCAARAPLAACRLRAAPLCRRHNEGARSRTPRTARCACCAGPCAPRPGARRPLTKWATAGAWCALRPRTAARRRGACQLHPSCPRARRCARNGGPGAAPQHQAGHSQRSTHLGAVRTASRWPPPNKPPAVAGCDLPDWRAPPAPTQAYRAWWWPSLAVLHALDSRGDPQRARHAAAGPSAVPGVPRVPRPPCWS